MYKCIRGFTTTKGDKYNYGMQIPFYDYNPLTVFEKRNFILLKEEILSTTHGRFDPLKEEEIIRLKRREEELMKKRQEEEEEEQQKRRRQNEEDNIRLNTIFNSDYGSSDIPNGSSYDSDSSTTDSGSVDYGGGDSGGGGASGDY